MGDQHLVNRVTLNIHAQNRSSNLAGFGWVFRQLHATRLATSPCLDLGFDNYRSVDRLGNRDSSVNVCCHVTCCDGEPVLSKKLLGLVFVQIH